MAINVLRGRGAEEHAEHAEPAPPLAIGDEDRLIFNCPACNRPLASGTRRCAGCRTLLVARVPLVRAAAFVGFGLLVGLLVGVPAGMASVSRMAGGATGAAPAGVTPASAEPASAAPASASPSSPTAAPSSSAPGPDRPAAATAALGQAAVIDSRLLAAAPELRAALGTSPVDTGTVVRVLRGVAADTGTAADVARRLGTWEQTSGLADELAAAYADLRDAALGTLKASPYDAAAYRAGATRALDALGRLSSLDARVGAVAAEIGLTLPTSPPAVP